MKIKEMGKKHLLTMLILSKIETSSPSEEIEF